MYFSWGGKRHRRQKSDEKANISKVYYNLRGRSVFLYGSFNTKRYLHSRCAANINDF
jgi:hypothetical protein